jgi:serine phosphatase RsbU (regulator of sigma subunit)
MLVQQGHAEEQKDGMDMAVVILDKKQLTLHFAGAQNPLYLVRKGSSQMEMEAGLEASSSMNGFQLYEIKGDRQPIGFHWEETSFTSHRIALQDGDTFYVFTDGFIDQFGGKKRKKFKSNRFKELLLSIQEESMDRQKQILAQTYDSWRGEIEQIDDVCVIGIRI